MRYGTKSKKSKYADDMTLYLKIKERNVVSVDTHILFQSGDFLFRLHQPELQVTDLSVGVSCRK